jgi:hypothetical protein
VPAAPPGSPPGAPPPAVTVYVRQTYNLPADVDCAAIDTAAFSRTTQSLLQNVRARRVQAPCVPGCPGAGVLHTGVAEGASACRMLRLPERE